MPYNDKYAFREIVSILPSPCQRNLRRPFFLLWVKEPNGGDTDHHLRKPIRINIPGHSRKRKDHLQSQKKCHLLTVLVILIVQFLPLYQAIHTREYLFPCSQIELWPVPAISHTCRKNLLKV